MLKGYTHSFHRDSDLHVVSRVRRTSLGCFASSQPASNRKDRVLRALRALHRGTDGPCGGSPGLVALRWTAVLFCRQGHPGVLTVLTVFKVSDIIQGLQGLQGLQGHQGPEKVAAANTDGAASSLDHLNTAQQIRRQVCWHLHMLTSRGTRSLMLIWSCKGRTANVQRRSRGQLHSLGPETA